MTGGVPVVIVTALLLKITRILLPFPSLQNAEGQIVGAGEGRGGGGGGEWQVFCAAGVQGSSLPPRKGGRCLGQAQL